MLAARASRPRSIPRRWGVPTALVEPLNNGSEMAYVSDVAWHPSGQLVALSGRGIVDGNPRTDYAKVARVQGDTIVALTDLPSLTSTTAGVTDGIVWSPEGDHVAVASQNTPFVIIYNRTGEMTFTKLADPATLPAGWATQPAYSPCGRLLALSHVTTPFVTIYQRSGQTYTKLANPATLPASTGLTCAFSPDGQFLVVGHATTPFITIYRISWAAGVPTFTKLADPASLPGTTPLGSAWSPDGRYLAISEGTTPFIHVYRVMGETFTKLANPASLPPGAVREISWGGANGRTLFCPAEATPWHIFYELDGDVLRKLTDVSSLGTMGNPTNAYIARWNPLTGQVGYGWLATVPADVGSRLKLLKAA